MIFTVKLDCFGRNEIKDQRPKTKDQKFRKIFGNKFQFAVSNQISPLKCGQKQIEKVPVSRETLQGLDEKTR